MSSLRLRAASLPIVVLLSAVTLGREAAAGPAWTGYAGDSTHSAISALPSQPLDGIRWQTPIDDARSGQLIHYGSPMITAANTVVVPVRQADGTHRVEGRDGGNGSLKWSQSSDYIAPTGSSWIPPYQPTLTPTSRLYFPGGGGSVFYRDSIDTTGAAPSNRIAFYGAYNAAYNAGVVINTPLTSDAAGNVYFGYRVTTWRA